MSALPGRLTDDVDLVRVQPSTAHGAARRALEVMGAPPEFAKVQADLLVESDLAGLPSHGLMRLPRILERIRNGVTDPAAGGVHEWQGPGLLHVDGQRGLGPVVVQRALDAAVEAMGDSGACVVAVRNNNHIGRLAHYAETYARRGLVFLGMSTSEALVHPWGGRRAMLGTNPIAFGVPAEPEPFVADLATSIVAMGKVHDYANRNQRLEPGWAVDAEGLPTLDAKEAKHGAIAPFGGAKGYALGLGIEVLVTALSGAAIGTAVAGTLDDNQVCNKGDLFILSTNGGEGPIQLISGYLQEIREGAPIEGFAGIDVPGDRARRTARANRDAGITLPGGVWETILAASISEYS